jgi:hypothetical protein
MASKRTARCAHCGEMFEVPRRSGPDPAYCSQAHRQRAYEQRRRNGRNEEEQAMAEELHRLRARAGVLDLENKQLRQALDESTDEIIRLRNELDTPSEGVRRFLETPHAATPRPEVEPPLRPRRWWSPAGR